MLSDMAIVGRFLKMVISYPVKILEIYLRINDVRYLTQNNSGPTIPGFRKYRAGVNA
jgi:hypothetical protein